METTKTNPKELNLEAVKQSHTKVTLGFKCPPSIKLDLAQKAHQLGLTLSEYVENLVMNFEKMVEQIKSYEKDENIRLTNTIKEQNGKIDFYENEVLKKILQKYKNQTAEFKNESNGIEKLKLTDIKAVYKMITNSFKIKEDHDHPNTVSFGEVDSK